MSEKLSNLEIAEKWADIRSEARYENWKTKKRKRKIWISVITIFLSLLLAYLAGNLLCKVGFNWN